MSDRRRSRTIIAALTLLTVALGLASRRYATDLPTMVAAYAGDVLWAAMAFGLLTFVWPSARTRWLAAGALAIATTVELSQLSNEPWLVALRETPLGAMALGQGFLWSDLVCYTIGVSLAALLDRALRAQRGTHAASHRAA